MTVRIALVDAKQQLEAQQQYGEKYYALAWEKKLHESIGLELDTEVKKAMMQKIRDEQKAPEPSSDDDDEITEALIARRDQLNATGLDTSKIDALLAARRKT